MPFNDAEIPPEIIVMLRSLTRLNNGRGVKIGILSNNPSKKRLTKIRANLENALEGLNLELYFPSIKGRKPLGRSFKHFLREMGVPEEKMPETVMIGDNRFSDIMGANRREMKTLRADWFPRRALFKSADSMIGVFHAFKGSCDHLSRELLAVLY